MEPPRENEGHPLPRRMSEEINGLIEILQKGSVPVRKVVETLQGRAFIMLLILLAVPFCQPVALPMVSTPFGLIIAFIGLRLALGREPWLPERLMKTSLHGSTFVKIFSAARKLLRGMEVLLRPRMLFLVEPTTSRRMLGIVICISGLLLLLPLPVPFSNLFPAVTILLAASAKLERDGLFAAGSYLMFVATMAFFGALCFGGAAAFDWGKDLIMGTAGTGQ